jgi:hypothetical protein
MILHGVINLAYDGSNRLVTRWLARFSPWLKGRHGPELQGPSGGALSIVSARAAVGRIRKTEPQL